MRRPSLSCVTHTLLPLNNHKEARDTVSDGCRSSDNVCRELSRSPRAAVVEYPSDASPQSQRQWSGPGQRHHVPTWRERGPGRGRPKRVGKKFVPPPPKPFGRAYFGDSLFGRHRLSPTSAARASPQGGGGYATRFHVSGNCHAKSHLWSPTARRN